MFPGKSQKTHDKDRKEGARVTTKQVQLPFMIPSTKCAFP